MAVCAFNLFFSFFLVTTIIVTGSGYKVEVLTKPEDGILESARWSVNESALYWVNYFGQKLYRLDTKTGQITSRRVCYGPTSFIELVKDYPGYVVVGVRASIYFLKWIDCRGDLALTLLSTLDARKPINSIDDGKPDAAGRMWCGTYGKLSFINNTISVPAGQGTVYSIDAQNYVVPTVRYRPVNFPNGLAWSPNNTKFYLSDTTLREILAFDFDLATGDISNGVTIFRFADYDIPGQADSMTIDSEGNIWCATFQSARILQVNPDTQKLVRQIDLSSRFDQVTSMVWGGPNLDWLYGTTGKLDVPKSKAKKDSGSIIKITGLKSKGLPGNQFVFPNVDSY